MNTVVDLRVERLAAPVREATAAKLREAIVGQRFAPGERLVERELCELTGVSRTSVREALRMLEAEGLVEVVPSRGPHVARPSRERVMEVYELREELEGLAARSSAARATQPQLEQLRELFESIAAAVAEHQSDGLLALKDAFYDRLFECAGNALAAEMFRQVRARVSMLRAVTLQVAGRDQAMLDEVRLVVDCIERRDAPGAQAAAKAHVRAAAQVALRAVDQHQDG